MKIFIAVLMFAGTLSVGSNQFYSRITGGFDAKARTFKSFVSLEIEFDRLTRTCGGLLYGAMANKIITSASCVVE